MSRRLNLATEVDVPKWVDGSQVDKSRLVDFGRGS